MTEKEKPLTREDVVKMIEEHGGPKGLDLSGRNLARINLSERDLHGIILRGANLLGADLHGATLFNADLNGANLIGANLQGSSLSSANLRDADLMTADLQGAVLLFAKLQGACLFGVEISQAINFEGADWGNYILNEEESFLPIAVETYRKLKMWHTEAGIYEAAGEFHYREMEARRKAVKWWSHPTQWKDRRWWGERVERLRLEIYRFLYGYGEKPWRVVISAAVVVFGLAGIYSASALTFPSALYHSAVSFTALGYGLGVSTADGWVKGLGAFEAFIGVFMMALFLITFIRKMTR